MPAVEDARHARIVLLELRAPRQANRILITEQTVAQKTVNLINAIELDGLHFPELADRILRDMKLQFAVSAPVQPFVFADEQYVVLLGQRERGVHANPLKAVKLLGVHRTHRGTDHQRRLFASRQIPEAMRPQD